MKYKSILMKISFSLFFIILYLYYRELGIFYVFILIHEITHCIVGAYLGYKISYIGILPFGLKANFRDEFIKPLDDIIVTASGPLINFVFFVIFHGLDLKFGGIFEFLKEANLIIFAFNLIPAGFLDGGRILRKVLMIFFNYFTAITLTNLNGIVFGCIIVIIVFFKGISLSGFPLLFLGIFFLYKSIIDQREIIINIIKITINKQNYLANGLKFNVRILAFNKKFKILDIIKYFCFNYYHVIYILEDGKIIYKMDEIELINLYFCYGNISLENSLKYINT